MAREIVWAESALLALDEAAEYIARDSIVYAIALVTGAQRAAESLSTLSDRGRMVPEYAHPDIREIFVGSYRLIYRVRDDSIKIVTFVHGSRDLASLVPNPPDA